MSLYDYDARKPVKTHSYKSVAAGRSSIMVVCPFCEVETRAFIWSLAGGGKKCNCGARLSLTYAVPLKPKTEKNV